MTPTASVIAYTKFLGVPAPHTPAGTQDLGTDAERLIETAGRCCYRSFGRGRDSHAFHENLRATGHLSVIEHANLSFFISGISVACSHELVRHRVGVAISQESGRYVDKGEQEWAWHPALALLDGPDRGAGLSCLMEDARTLYHAIVERLEPLVGRKQARGAARGVLGTALSTSLVFTCNLHALRWILYRRATPEADAEIRALAVAMHTAALPYAPAWLGDYEQYNAPDGLGVCLRTTHPPPGEP